MIFCLLVFCREIVDDILGNLKIYQQNANLFTEIYKNREYVVCFDFNFPTMHLAIATKDKIKVYLADSGVVDGDLLDMKQEHEHSLATPLLGIKFLQGDSLRLIGASASGHFLLLTLQGCEAKRVEAKTEDVSCFGVETGLCEGREEVVFGSSKGEVGWFLGREVEKAVVVKSPLGGEAGIRKVCVANDGKMIVFLQGENTICACEKSDPLRLLGSFKAEGVVACFTLLPELNCLAFATANTASIMLLSLAEKLKVVHTIEANIPKYFSSYKIVFTISSIRQEDFWCLDIIASPFMTALRISSKFRSLGDRGANILLRHGL